MLHSEGTHLSSGIHQVFTSTPSTATSLSNEPTQLVHHHSQHTKTPSDSHITPILSSGSVTPDSGISQDLWIGLLWVQYNYYIVTCQYQRNF